MPLTDYRLLVYVRLWDLLLAGMYDRSARVYDPAKISWSQSVERLLLDIFEATRGHLTGPRRDGEFSVAEEDDRWVITFAPCGAGPPPVPTLTTWAVIALVGLLALSGLASLRRRQSATGHPGH